MLGLTKLEQATQRGTWLLAPGRVEGKKNIERERERA